MKFYVDGDNSYKARINGIKSLSNKDTVYIYYNGNNAAFNRYTGETFAKTKNCRCKVEFIKVKNIPQAVDFAIAIDVATTNLTATEELIIVGEDKHLKTIKEILNGDNITYAQSIANVLDKKFKEIDDIMDYIDFVNSAFCPDMAKQLIHNQIKMSIQLNKYANEIYSRTKEK